MRRLTAVALLVAGLAIPVCAQRTASRGSFSGHSSPAFRSEFSHSASSRFPASPRSGESRSFGTARGLQRGASGNGFAHSPDAGARQRRDRHSHRTEYPYGLLSYGYPGWIEPYPLSYPYAIVDDDSEASNPAPEENDAYPGEQPLPPSPPLPSPERTQPSPVPDSVEAVTLVFKDGRSPVQIHNYLLTRTMLYVRDQQHREIPTDQLDLAATAKVNQAAGVDFQLPSTLK